jgi:hypothetical protein
MNTPTPTPRTDAAWSSSFDGKQLSAGQTARALRECSQKLETELAALHANLATERARLDYLLKWEVTFHSREDIDRDMKGCLYEVRGRCELWKQRAEKAEAQLAIERARLDWLETPSGMDWQWEPERLTVSRASIDAKMTEDAK